jgi:hypothetical protein
MDSNFIFSKPGSNYNSKELVIDFETESIKFINVFEFEGRTYYNCFDKLSKNLVVLY